MISRRIFYFVHTIGEQLFAAIRAFSDYGKLREINLAV